LIQSDIITLDELLERKDDSKSTKEASAQRFHGNSFEQQINLS